jgi:hypothetical protein
MKEVTYQIVSKPFTKCEGVQWRCTLVYLEWLLLDIEQV